VLDAVRTVLRRALGQAVREGIMSRNVASLSAAPRVRAREGPTLTIEQARLLLGAGPALVGTGQEGWHAAGDKRAAAESMSRALFGG
jgi:hypothetical protein